MNIFKYIVVLGLCILLSLIMWIASKNFLTGLLSGSLIFISYVILNLLKSSNENIVTQEGVQPINQTSETKNSESNNSPVKSI